MAHQKPLSGSHTRTVTLQGLADGIGWTGACCGLIILKHLRLSLQELTWACTSTAGISPAEHGVQDGRLSIYDNMMLQNSAPLAVEEQALSNSITQLAASVYQDIQALGGLDVAVQTTVLQGITAKVQDQLRRYRSLLSDLQHAAEEQET